MSSESKNKSSERDSLVDTMKSVLLARTGTLTRDLLRKPGGFGLGQVPSRLAPDSTTSMVCGFCSTGCGLDIHLRDGQAINLSPAVDYSVNVGMACPKGWEALRPLSAPDRAVQPMIRRNRGEDLTAVSWEEALGTFTSKMKEVQDKHGKESVAFISTGQIPSEEMALLGAVAKFGMGMLEGDGNTRQCMATAVVSYKQSFGFDAPPYTYDDFEQSDVIVLIGSNLCIAHPIMWEHVCRNKNKPEIVVIDPRRTETAQASTLHLPIKPKSDLNFFYGIAKILIDKGWVDQEFIDKSVEGYEEFKEHLSAYKLDEIAEQSGIALDTIESFAQMIHEGKRVSFWWTMGVNQSHEGVRTAQAIINLALITGNIGRPGTGANSITGQCNAMGSRLFSNTTALFAGRDFTKPDDRQKTADILGINVDLIPERASKSYDQIMEGIHRGQIKALWIIATNTAHSWINQEDAKHALGQLDFLVVQDMYHSTETAAFADLVLPAAAWGEKDGTFINSERRIGLLKKVSRAPGQALADFYIFKLIAEAWGCGDLFRRWENPEATFRILQECTKGTPCDITGINGYDDIEALRGIQWPLPEGQRVEAMSQRRLFEDGIFYRPNGKAKLWFESSREVDEPTDKRYPFILLSGRGSSSQWHTQTRTSKSDVLRKLYSAEPYVEISPVDARALDIAQNDWVRVESRRGRMKARAFITNVVQPGQVFVPMHYSKMNRLTFPAFDPYSRQPSYKHCAVRIRAEDSIPGS